MTTPAMLKQVFRNLLDVEYDLAVRYLKRLHPVEQDRLVDTLEAINRTTFCLVDTPPPCHQDRRDILPRHEKLVSDMCTLAAGSSINQRVYKDIDMFVIPKEPLPPVTTPRANPEHVFISQLRPKLPKDAYAICYNPYYSYGVDMDAEEKARFARTDTLPEGAIITVSLIHEVDFSKQRDSRPDIIVPEEPVLGADDFISYNLCQGTKFVVLSRQYEPQDLTNIYELIHRSETFDSYS